MRTISVFLASMAVLVTTSSSVDATPRPFRWQGETHLQSYPTGRPSEADQKAPLVRPADGTLVKVTSKTKAKAVVTDAFGPREVGVPGEFRAAGPVRVRIDFGTDDFFERTLRLPDGVDGGKGETVVVAVPDKKSQFVLAGAKKIPVSRGVKVVTWKDDKKLDLAALLGKAPGGGPHFGPRYLRPGVKGVDIRQMIFGSTRTDTIAAYIDRLIERGLSTHLLIDREGTLFQLLDLEHCAYFSGDANNHGVGIHFVDQGQHFRYDEAMTRQRFAAMSAAEQERWLAKAKRVNPSNELDTDAGDEDYEHPNDVNVGVKDPDKLRPVAGPATFHTSQIMAYGLSPASIRTATATASALLSAFPSIPRNLPVDRHGKALMREAEDPTQWGIVGAFHWSTWRWDPGPGFDWQAMADLLITLRP